MGNLGGGEILIILLAALLFLGPQKLPDAARQIGKAMAEFRKITSGFQREIRDAINDDGAVEAEARARGDALVAQESPAATPPIETSATETVLSVATTDSAAITDSAAPVDTPAPSETAPSESTAPTTEAVPPPSGDR
jgi:Tat protein translocase TatB subunit